MLCGMNMVAQTDEERRVMLMNNVTLYRRVYNDLNGYDLYEEKIQIIQALFEDMLQFSRCRQDMKDLYDRYAERQPDDFTEIIEDIQQHMPHNKICVRFGTFLIRMMLLNVRITEERGDDHMGGSFKMELCGLLRMVDRLTVAST